LIGKNQFWLNLYHASTMHCIASGHHWVTVILKFLVSKPLIFESSC